MRAVLFARATVATLKGRRASSPAIHAPAFAAPAEPLLAAGRMLFRNQTDPGGKVPPRGEGSSIADCCYQRRGGNRPDARNGDQLAADLVLPCQRQQLLIKGLNLALDIANLLDQLQKSLAGDRRHALIRTNERHQFARLRCSSRSGNAELGQCPRNALT